MSTSQIHRRELIQTLGGLKKRIAANEPECECDVFEDLGEPNRFLWIERWPTPGDADRAMSSERFRTLLGAVRVLGTLEGVFRVDQSGVGPAERPVTNKKDDRAGTARTRLLERE